MFWQSAIAQTESAVKMLKQTQHGISSIESDSHGMIAEAFLSHDARHGVKHAREV
ncbi:T7SS effector LXG polymorphic toxin, partial [Bacillus inaquosorum]|uniref:T7SS effector LXG polymorphic toxin n=1 Tax=Bacillus inaquosorum TaxID=483913 RepID=UPI00227FC18E